MDIKNIKLSKFDRWFWYIMYFFLFGYSCLGIPGGAGLRPIICACVTFFSILVYARCIRYKYHSGLATYILSTIFLAIFMGFVNGGTLTGEVLDTTVCVGVIMAIYMMRFPPVVILRFLCVSAICSFVFFLWSFIYNPFGTDDVVSRGAIDSEAFIGACMLWPLAITVAFVTVYKKDIKPFYYYIGYAYWGFCLIVNMLFLKRAIFTDSAFLILGLIWFYKWCKHKSLFSTLFIVLFSIAIVTIVINLAFDKLFDFELTAILERIQERFDQVDETGTVRIDESTNYYKGATWDDILLGKGFGVAHHGLGLDKTNTALHIGINNLVLKHGFFMIILYVFMILSIIFKVAFRPRLTEMQQVCAITVLAGFPTFILYTNFWLSSPIYCFMWYAIFYVYFPRKNDETETTYNLRQA